MTRPRRFGTKVLGKATAILPTFIECLVRSDYDNVILFEQLDTVGPDYSVLEFLGLVTRKRKSGVREKEIRCQFIILARKDELTLDYAGLRTLRKDELTLDYARWTSTSGRRVRS